MSLTIDYGWQFVECVLSMNSWRIQWNKFPNFSRWDNFTDFHPLWISLYRLWLKETLLVESRLLSNRFFPLLFKKILLLPTCNPTSIWNVFGCYICGKRKKSIHWMLWGMRNEYQDHHYSAYSASLPLFFAFATSKVKMYHVTPPKKFISRYKTECQLFVYIFVELSADC